MCYGAQVAIFASFLRPVFAASRVQHISDLHSKLALRPHHVYKYGIDIKSATGHAVRLGEENRR